MRSDLLGRLRQISGRFLQASSRANRRGDANRGEGPSGLSQSCNGYGLSHFAQSPKSMSNMQPPAVMAVPINGGTPRCHRPS